MSKPDVDRGDWWCKPHDHCWRLSCILPRVPAKIVRTGVFDDSVNHIAELLRDQSYAVVDDFFSTPRSAHGTCKPHDYRRSLGCVVLSKSKISAMIVRTGSTSRDLGREIKAHWEAGKLDIKVIRTKVSEIRTASAR